MKQAGENITDCSGKVGLPPHTVKHSGKASSIDSLQMYFTLAGIQTNVIYTPPGVDQRLKHKI